jgi:hypothetical protein
MTQDGKNSFLGEVGKSALTICCSKKKVPVQLLTMAIKGQIFKLLTMAIKGQIFIASEIKSRLILLKKCKL